MRLLGQSENTRSWFEIIAHGMGLYFIAKGILLGPIVWRMGDR